MRYKTPIESPEAKDFLGFNLRLPEPYIVWMIKAIAFYYYSELAESFLGQSRSPHQAIYRCLFMAAARDARISCTLFAKYFGVHHSSYVKTGDKYLYLYKANMLTKEEVAFYEEYRAFISDKIGR